MNNSAMTVCGPVPVDNLGMTNIHEHIFFGLPGYEFDADYKFDEELVMKIAVDKIEEAKKYGVKTIVDATPYAPIRFPRLLKKTMEQTGVNIIASTGIFHSGMGVSLFWRDTLNYGFDRSLLLGRLTRSMIKELNVGIADTDIRAGAIKLSTDSTEITEFDKLAFTAAGQASKETGAPIQTHTSGAKFALEQADMLLDAGAAPGKIAIGHMTDTMDLDYLQALLEKGVYVNFDRMGMSITLPEGDEGKVQTLVELVKRGYADQLMLSHDYMVSHVNLGPLPDEMMKQFPHWNLHGLHDYFIPQMKEMGVSDAQIETMTVKNPAKFFA